jgi:hypothetical protein
MIKEEDKKEEILVNMLSGAISAGATTFLLFPLDQIKIYSQLSLAQ